MWSIENQNIKGGKPSVDSTSSKAKGGCEALLARVISSGADYQVTSYCKKQGQHKFWINTIRK